MMFKNYMNDDKKIIVFNQKQHQVDYPYLEINKGRFGVKNE